MTGYFAFVPFPVETVPPAPDAVPCDVDDDEDSPLVDEAFPLFPVLEPLSPCVDQPCVPPADTFVFVPDSVPPTFCDEPFVLSVPLGVCEVSVSASFEFAPFPFEEIFALADESVLLPEKFPFEFEFSIDSSVTGASLPICGLAGVSVSSAISLLIRWEEGCGRIGSVF